MAEKGHEWKEFMGMLRRRKLSVDALARALNGPVAVKCPKTGKESQRGSGRTHLWQVLRGRRSGGPTWGKLETVLTKREFDHIRAFARREFERLSLEGKIRESVFVKKQVQGGGE